MSAIKTLQKQLFFNLVLNYFKDTKIIHKVWNRLTLNYENNSSASAEKSVRRKITQIDTKVQGLKVVKDDIKMYHTLLFALYYYNVNPSSTRWVYEPFNLEKSIEYIQKDLKTFKVPLDLRNKIIELIQNLGDESIGTESKSTTDIDLIRGFISRTKIETKLTKNQNKNYEKVTIFNNYECIYTLTGY